MMMNCTIETRLRRAFGKRPPAPRKTKRKTRPAIRRNYLGTAFLLKHLLTHQQLAASCTLARAPACLSALMLLVVADEPPTHFFARVIWPLSHHCTAGFRTELSAPCPIAWPPGLMMN